MGRVACLSMIAAVLLMTAACQPPTRSSGAVKDYVLSIEGTQGLALNLLVITKPTAGSIERETISTVIPFTKEFKAVACAVWLDAEFKGKGGDYRMVLTRNGIATAEVSGDVKEGHKATALVHDL